MGVTYDDYIRLGLDPRRAEQLSNAVIVGELSQEAADRAWDRIEASVRARREAGEAA